MFVQSVDSSSSRPDVAFLVFAPLKQRRDDNSFDGNDNIGAKVIADTLEREGIRVGFCAPETAHQYQIVLVSLTSTYDVFAFYQAVALRPDWQPKARRFTVVAGGFGMQNPTSVRHYIDYAAFGRAEDWITPVIESLLGGGIPSAHPSLMALPDMHPVVIHQSAHLYDRAIGDFRETFTGCPLKCKFCHYTWAREYKDERAEATRGTYVQESLTGGGTPELTFDQLYTYGRKAGRVRAAIDGFSERLRYVYGKRLSNQDIIGGIEAIGQYGGVTTLLIYNIANFPTETPADREELYETLRAANPKDRVIFVLHSTPFRPSLATPMQWEPVSLFPDNSKLRQQVIAERPNFRAVHSFTIETPWSHLMSVIAERATPETDALFHACAFSPKLRNGLAADKVRRVQAHFDITPYIKAYDFDEPHPAWFLDGYIERVRIAKIARKMRADIQRTQDEPGWKPGGVSLVEARMRKSKPVFVDVT